MVRNGTTRFLPPLGILLMAVLWADLGLPAQIQTVSGIIGLVLLLGGTYWYGYRARGRGKDERQRDIQHRAGYIAFWTVSTALGLAVFGSVVLATPVPEATESTTFLVVGVLAVPLFLGVIVYLIAEGWYNSQI